MKEYINLIKYHFVTYSKTKKYIMPMIIWIILAVSNYSMGPLNIVSSLSITVTYTFFIMVWVSLSYFEGVDVVLEQILLLKVKKKRTYYISKYIFLILVGVIFSICGIIVPVVQNALSGFDLFFRTICFGDLIWGFCIHVIGALLGISVASICQPLCIEKRKLALPLAVLVSILAVIKEPLSKSVPSIKYALWIFPPVADINNLFYRNEFFTFGKVGLAIVFGVVYSTILISIAQAIINKKRY